jgi:hypothetical protein
LKQIYILLGSCGTKGATKHYLHPLGGEDDKTDEYLNPSTKGADLNIHRFKCD